MKLTQAKFTCPFCQKFDRVFIVPLMPQYGVKHQCQQCKKTWEVDHARASHV